MATRPDSSDLLAGITCPTTVLCGGEDVLTPLPEVESLHRMIAGSRFVTLPRAGHLSNLEDPYGFSLALFAERNQYATSR
jgi:pimeloyl-ACP methyl ester carboxylesterase